MLHSPGLLGGSLLPEAGRAWAWNWPLSRPAAGPAREASLPISGEWEPLPLPAFSPGQLNTRDWSQAPSGSDRVFRYELPLIRRVSFRRSLAFPLKSTRSEVPRQGIYRINIKQ